MTVTATAHDDRVKRRNGAKHNGDARPVLVTAGALATHLSCVRSYIAKLVDQGVLERRSDGRFDQDQCRDKYISHLKEERKRSPRSEADAAFAAAKAELINIRIAEKRKLLMLASDHASFVEKMMGLFLAGLSGFAAQIAGRDIAKRHVVDRVVYDLRVQIADAAGKLADEEGEPAMDADA